MGFSRNKRVRWLLGAAAGAVAAALLSPVAPAFAVAGGVTAAPSVQCVGNGTSGNRVQMLYVYESGGNRFTEREADLRTAAWEAQQDINDSARREGAQRWLQYVSSATGCSVTINQVQIAAGASNDSPVSIFDTLKGLGYNASNRIYVVYAEQRRIGCAATANDGVGNDDSPGTANTHNAKTAWSVFMPTCFDGHTLTHELAHALGAMMPQMPHAAADGHCSDGNETLCQNTATVACPDPMAVRLLDCNKDDYFGITPAGTYLPTHYNVAKDSLYLSAGSATTMMTTILPLAPQLLRAADVEGTSIAFGFRPSVAAQGSAFTSEFELLRAGTVVQTIPGWKRSFRLTGLANSFAGSYTVRQKITYGGVARYSAASPALSVTTNTTTATAGAVETGATMMFTSDIIDGSGANLAMDVFSFSNNDNAGVVQWPGNAKQNQSWTMTTSGTGYKLVANHSDKCLAVGPGNTVVQNTCNGSTAQQWTFPLLSGVTYQVKSVSANLCVQSPNTTAGTGLVVGTCSSTDPSQRWTANRSA